MKGALIALSVADVEQRERFTPLVNVQFGRGEERREGGFFCDVHVLVISTEMI